MGGHGGLNILPQKRWNVYNYDNREKVRQDEEAAAREEQLKREQSRKRDAEFRFEKLRQARGLAPPGQTSSVTAGSDSLPGPESESKSKLNHINLFEGIKIFDPVSGVEGKGDDERGSIKKMKMMKKEAVPRVVAPEDEKYRLGYGIAGKGVKLPWYLSRSSDAADADNDDQTAGQVKQGVKRSGKKTLEELREERLKREKREKKRERALLLENGQRDGGLFKDRGFSRR
ncbi:hypothetical protein U1Q18_021398 [Sarracenia purpurea var. burkii]